MPRGSKEAYTSKQKRQAQHIEEGYEEKGVSEKESGRRAWATVNKVSGGGKKSGSGVGKKENKAPMRKGGKKGGKGIGGNKATGKAAKSAGKKKSSSRAAPRKSAGKAKTTTRKSKSRKG